MTKVFFQGKCFEMEANESVLECLHRNEIAYPSSCKTGICQSCLAQGVKEEIDPAWQKGLKETLVQQNYFLACLAKPSADIHLKLPGIGESTTPAMINSLHWLNHNVVRLRLSIDNLDEWVPGQYVSLINPEGIIRSYSIANLPKQDGFIELHIKMVPTGAMSSWIKARLSLGEQVHMRGPAGQCFYLNPNKDTFPMVLAGTGTGLAPLIAIARDALFQQHAGEICLIHGGCVPEDLYLDETLTELAAQHKNFTYVSCVLKGNGHYQQAAIDKLILNYLNDKTRTRVYVCGPPETTKLLKTKAFLAGIASGHIYSDAFVY